MRRQAIQRETGVLRDIRRAAERTIESQHWTRLDSPQTSTLWDGGDPFSTTAKTLINLNSVFGVPENVRTVYVYVKICDSGSAGGMAYLLLSPSDVANRGMQIEASGLPNNQWRNQYIEVPCNGDGNLYYQISATGAGTMRILIHIWGWEK